VSAGGENATVLQQNGALFNHRLGHNERSGERDGRLLAPRGQRKKCDDETTEKTTARISHAWVRVYRTARGGAKIARRLTKLRYG
jgi:hypothetical protein